MTSRLTQRHLEILNILISDYIASAQPVASRTIARKHSDHLSPATVRNVMADLAELGLISQPHISAGRLPTDAGMRLYIDTLLNRRELSDEEMDAIRSHCGHEERRIDAALRRTSKMLAAVSRYAGLIVTPDSSRIAFKQIEFIPLSGRRLLGIFVSQEGRVENRLLEVSEEFTYPELERINNYCNQAFMGLTLDDAIEKAGRELTAERTDYDQLLKQAMSLSHEVLSCVPGSDLVVDGEVQLLDEPEFANAEAFRRVMEAIEEKRSILHVLERCREGDGVRVFLGADAGLENMDSLGVVGAPYFKNGKIVGALGVIGPMRMDYSRVVPIVDFTAKVLSDVLAS